MTPFQKMRKQARPAVGLALAAAIALPEPALAYGLRWPIGPGMDLPGIGSFADLGLEELLQAQVDTGQDNEPRTETRQGDGGGTVGTPVPLSDARTAAIVGIITDGKDQCELLPWEYRLDCLYHVIDRAAKATPKGVDYAPVRKALEKAAKRLDRVRKKHSDAGSAKKAFRSPDGTTTTPPLQPVRRQEREAVIRETDAILQETSTVLLRSAGDDPQDLEQFTRVVQAVDSTRLLLRSA